MTFPTPPSPTKKSQKVVIGRSAYELKLRIDEAYEDGWYVHHVTTSHVDWLAVLTK